jgi:hypothetical protein
MGVAAVTAGAVEGFAADQTHQATNRVHNARKFGQQAIAGILDDPAPVFRDLRIDQLPEVSLQPLMGPLLIGPHQARAPCHVGGEDRGEAADRGHFSPGGKVP